LTVNSLTAIPPAMHVCPLRRFIGYCLLLPIVIASGCCPLAPPRPATRPASQPVTMPATAPAAQAPSAFDGPAGGFPASPPVGPVLHVQLITAPDEKEAWYHLLAPKDYSPKTAWPLMVVLHGGPGGNGPDDIIAFYKGLPRMGVITVLPNALSRTKMLEWNYPNEAEYLIYTIRQVAQTYRIDPHRIYLTGVSMGGGGTWANGAILHDVWAAIGPVAGFYKPSVAPPVEMLKGMPIYILHGQRDPIIPIGQEELAVKELKELGDTVQEVTTLPATTRPDLVAYREVPNAPHNMFMPWDPHGHAEWASEMDWLLSHRRQTPADLDAAERSLEAWGKQAFNWSPIPATQPATAQ
jgi:predicted esterase